MEIPVIKIKNLVLFGNVQISTQAVQLLLQKGIDISYNSVAGKFYGKTSSAIDRNVFLKLAQYDTYKNHDKCIRFAKTIVSAKIDNQIVMIKRRMSGNKNITFINVINNLSIAKQKVDSASMRDELMGLEGITSRQYFSVLDFFIKSRLDFGKRTRRPAHNPINALFNLGYVSLTNQMTSLLSASSLDVCLGFFHGIKYGRQSLALDMVEEFRQPVIDNMIINILNKRIIKENDFLTDDSTGFRLNKEGFKKFFDAYYSYTISGSVQFSVQDLMKKQIMCLREFIIKNLDYRPFHMVE